MSGPAGRALARGLGGLRKLLWWLAMGLLAAVGIWSTRAGRRGRRREVTREVLVGTEESAPVSTDSRVEEQVCEDESRKTLIAGGDQPWLRAIGISNRGKVRSENQDRFVLEELPSRAVAAVVADGMGGHMGGSHAAQIATSTIIEVLRNGQEANNPSLYERLETSFARADEAIRSRASQDAHLGGMGTTGVAAVVTPDQCVHLYTGDSRLYMYRGGSEFYRTKDHSVVRYLEEEGLLTAEEARNHPMRSRLTSSLGGGPAERKLVLEPRWMEGDEACAGQPSVLKLQSGDLLLLCSDGLCGEVEPKRLAELVGEYYQDPEKLARACVEAALEAGGRDNITVVLLQVV